ncbi:hypothetical protein EDB92DRAFT_1891144 [Lactarius akahatsu]|uniref:Secreted protein n=1 Tax=Lactarius akahatsu TaxID=416441 RepID=A0AAD4L7T7_9AGAM|nr:hypothetical protein EDB92DRAFT_1891144 [Lactarius akahatsu]
MGFIGLKTLLCAQCLFMPVPFAWCSGHEFFFPHPDERELPECWQCRHIRCYFRFPCQRRRCPRWTDNFCGWLRT